MAKCTIPIILDAEDFKKAMEKFRNENPDLEVVVRCKDCKHNYDTSINHGKMHPKCDFMDLMLTENDYCSHGERKETE